MIGFSELRLNCLAHRAAAKPMRHAVAAFLAAATAVDRETRDDILTAVGEVLANAVEHAYPEVGQNAVELLARVGKDRRLTIDVFDRGTFLDRQPEPHRGFGLRIVREIAETVAIDRSDGTHVSMSFRLSAPPSGGVVAS